MKRKQTQSRTPPGRRVGKLTFSFSRCCYRHYLIQCSQPLSGTEVRFPVFRRGNWETGRWAGFLIIIQSQVVELNFNLRQKSPSGDRVTNLSRCAQDHRVLAQNMHYVPCVMDFQSQANKLGQLVAQGQTHKLQNLTDLILNSTSTLPDCMFLGQLLNHSKSQFIICKIVRTQPMCN